MYVLAFCLMSWQSRGILQYQSYTPPCLHVLCVVLTRFTVKKLYEFIGFVTFCLGSHSNRHSCFQMTAQPYLSSILSGWQGNLSQV